MHASYMIIFPDSCGAQVHDKKIHLVFFHVLFLLLLHGTVLSFFFGPTV